MFLNNFHRIRGDEDMMFAYGRGNASNAEDPQRAKIQNNIQYMNALLKDLFEEWKHKERERISRENEEGPTAYHNGAQLKHNLSTHSARSGSATYADQHSSVHTQHVIMRGGWSVEGIQTIFNYIVGTAKTDSIVGRALSNYTTADTGGLCHVDDSFKGSPHKNKFLLYAETLIEHPLEYNLKLALVSTLVMHVLELNVEYGNSSITYSKMVKAAHDCNITEDELFDWGQQIKTWFITNNAHALPLSQLRNEDVIPAHTVKDHLARSDSMLKNISVAILEHKQQLKNTEQQFARILKEKDDRIQALQRNISKKDLEIALMKQKLSIYSSLEFGNGDRVETQTGISISRLDSILRDPVISNSENEGSCDSEEETLVSRLQRKDNTNRMTNKHPKVYKRKSDEIETNIMNNVLLDSLPSHVQHIVENFLTEKNIEMKNCFINWYELELHNIAVPEPFRRKVNDFKKTIFFMKLSIEKELIINVRPKHNPIELKEWRKNIIKIADEGASALVSLISKSLDERTSNKMQKVKSPSKYVRAIAKSVNHVPISSFQSTMKVVDKADRYVTSNMALYTKLSKHQKKINVSESNKVSSNNAIMSDTLSDSSDSDEAREAARSSTSGLTVQSTIATRRHVVITNNTECSTKETTNNTERIMEPMFDCEF